MNKRLICIMSLLILLAQVVKSKKNKTKTNNCSKCETNLDKTPHQNIVCRNTTEWVIVYYVKRVSTNRAWTVYNGKVNDVWKPPYAEWTKSKLFNFLKKTHIFTYNSKKTKQCGLRLKRGLTYILSGKLNSKGELFVDRCKSLHLIYEQGSLHTQNLRDNFLNNCDCQVKWGSFIPCEDTVNDFVVRHRTDNDTCVGRLQYLNCENTIGFCERTDGVCRWNTFVGDFFVREDIHGCRTAACGGPLPGPSYCHAQLQHSC